MKYAVILLLVVLQSATPRLCAAGTCNSCAGDDDADGTVTIDEIMAAVNSAFAGCDEVASQEQFLGSQVNPQRWRVSTNGFLSGVRVGQGALQVGQPGHPALDFPYIESVASVFPPDGDFQLDVTMQFVVSGPNGAEFSVIGADGQSLLRIRQQLGNPARITLTVPGLILGMENAPDATHVYTLRYRNAKLGIFMDGDLVVEIDAPARPARLWIGEPTVGQFYGIDNTSARPPGVSDTGIVTGRNWSEGLWSVLRIESIIVRRLSPGTAAPSCTACPGDRDGDGVVSIDEIIAAVDATLNGCDGVNFTEPFAGNALNPEHWHVLLNGSSAASVRVENGFLNLAVDPGAPDFPYVESIGSIFPETGDIQVDVALQFADSGRNATHVTLVGADTTTVRVHLRQADPALIYSEPGSYSTLNGFDRYAPHVFSFVFHAGFVDSFIDHSPIAGNVPFGTRPVSIWIGQPSIGQFFGPADDPDARSKLDPNGVILERWWQPNTWSALRIDSITVRHWPPPAD